MYVRAFVCERVNGEHMRRQLALDQRNVVCHWVRQPWEPSGSGDGGTKGMVKNKVEEGCVYQVPVLKGQT